MRAVFVLCEGAHDIAFLKHILNKLCGFTDYKKKISEYPGVLSRLLLTQLKNLSFEDHPVTRLPKAIMPERVFTYDQHLYLFINAGGKDRYKDVVAYLNGFITLFEAMSRRGLAGIDGYDVLFIADADRLCDQGGVSKTLARMKDEYQTLDIDIQHLEHSVWQSSGKSRIGCFIFSKPNEDEGTLEDLVLPLVVKQRGEEIEGAKQYISQFADDNRAVRSNPSAFQKATLTICGQLEKPGRPLSAIINDLNKWFPKAELEKCETCRQLAKLFSNTGAENKEKS